MEDSKNGLEHLCLTILEDVEIFIETINNSSYKLFWSSGSSSPNMRSIMGFLLDVKEGPKGLPGLKVDFQTIPIAIPIDMNICIFIYSQ